MANYRIAEDLNEIADTVINRESELSHLKSPGVKIAFQYSDEEKCSNKKKVYADTEKVKDKFKLFIPYDFVITFYESNCMELSNESMERLMFHELLHVGFDGDKKYYIVPHDFEDFSEVVRRWGTEWIGG